MNNVSPMPPPELRVLAMALSDARQTTAAAGAANAQGAPPADVIIELSTAARQLLGK